MTTEATIVKHIKPTCKAFGLRPIRISMRPGVEVGWPDHFIMGANGKWPGMESKRPGEKPKPIQLERGKEMQAYGNMWCKVDSKEDVEYFLEQFARFSIGERIVSRKEWDMQRNA